MKRPATLWLLGMLTLGTPVFGEDADCRLSVNKAEVISGPCEYTETASDGSYQVASPDGAVVAEIKVTAPNVADAFWNAGQAGAQAEIPLGVAVLLGACWANGNIKLCVSK